MDARSDAGFYVDVGAFHPMQYSNTYAFYLEGWRGINIEARPGSVPLFDRMRPRDINLELAIGPHRTTSTYFEFSEPALNGFCPDLQRSSTQSIVQTHEIRTVTLAEVLGDHLPPRQTIDFMTVDVEGMDEVVLASNDWSRFRPLFVLAEELEFPGFSRMCDSKVVAFLSQVGYSLCSKTANTLIFRRCEDDAECLRPGV
jgi:FkbM family methyltransferase